MNAAYRPKRKIGDLAQRVTVGFVGSQSALFTEQGVPLLRGQNIEPYRIDFTNLKFISNETHQSWRKSALQPGDVVIVRVGYPGTAAVVPDFAGELNAASLVIVRPNRDHLDAAYLAYVLNSPWGRSTISGLLVGSAQQVLNTGTVANLEVPTPTIDTQRRIAFVLGAYDQLIEVNRRRIAALEEMARRLFDEWFVRFRFPGHEDHAIVETPDGTLPEGWQRGVLGDLINLAYGRALKADARVPGPFPVIGSSGVVGWHEEAMVEGPGIVVGRKGNVGAIIWSARDFCPIDTVYHVETSRPMMYLLHQLRRLTFLNSDAAVPGLNRKAALSVPITIPPLTLMREYEAKVEPMLKLADGLRNSNTLLGSSRDLWLPGLVSGELSVVTAERELEDVA